MGQLEGRRVLGQLEQWEPRQKRLQRDSRQEQAAVHQSHSQRGLQPAVMVAVLLAVVLAVQRVAWPW